MKLHQQEVLTFTINISLKTDSNTKTMIQQVQHLLLHLMVLIISLLLSGLITGDKFGNSVNFDGQKVYEGTYVTTRYTVDTSDLEQRFILRDNRADTSTLTVKVQNSGSTQQL